jgi:cytochrome c biogenesis protein CcmG, thiol:disulfide interchange protein DsbE
MTDTMEVKADLVDQPSASATAGAKRSRLVLILPLAVFAAIGVFLGVGLTLNPRLVPSPLIGKAVPEFRLPAVQGRTLGLSTADLKGEVSLVNVFASWCVACLDEHPLLMDLQRAGTVPIHGLNYKDPPADAERWLAFYGDPYTRTGADVNGRVGIDWGVYGVPETFVIDKQGRIAYKHIGPIKPDDLRKKILPLVEQLRR